MMQHQFVSSLAAALAVVVFATAPANAASHLWRFNEVYSNAAGTVQFIELLGEASGQHLLESLGNTLSSNSHPLPDLDIFGSNLPSSSTLGKSLLIGSTNYAALLGVPAPDYTMPNNFFSVLGDTIIFTDNGAFCSVACETITFLASDLPTDGINSLSIDGSGSFSVAQNSPTNFAGDMGSVPEPGAALLLATGLIGLAVRRRSLRTSAMGPG